MTLNHCSGVWVGPKSAIDELDHTLILYTELVKIHLWAYIQSFWFIWPCAGSGTCMSNNRAFLTLGIAELNCMMSLPLLKPQLKSNAVFFYFIFIRSSRSRERYLCSQEFMTVLMTIAMIIKLTFIYCALIYWNLISTMLNALSTLLFNLHNQRKYVLLSSWKYSLVLFMFFSSKSATML